MYYYITLVRFITIFLSTVFAFSFFHSFSSTLARIRFVETCFSANRTFTRQMYNARREQICMHRDALSSKVRSYRVVRCPKMDGLTFKNKSTKPAIYLPLMWLNRKTLFKNPFKNICYFVGLIVKNYIFPAPGSKRNVYVDFHNRFGLTSRKNNHYQ